ncbi:MAG TPA: SDR family oxidoreductase [Solirubrobacteraceae bacterium]|nr:SDR family oxidoreductase [Solirubrobacteraceae bacterium]
MSGAPRPDGVLDGRRALITGGSRGLGRVAAMTLSRAGAEVMIASRRLDSCLASAREIEAETGRRVLACACHVGHWDQLGELVEHAYTELGGLEILVNNAGSSPVYERLGDVTEELWRKVIDINLGGPFRLSALVGERMVADGGGSIINISSVASEHPTHDVLPYAAAKAGLNALTIGLARAFGPSVRVNAILPGTFLTDVSAHWDMERFAAESAGFALARGADPEEIAGAILYLAGDASSYTTGSLLRVDGGYLEPPRRPR